MKRTVPSMLLAVVVVVAAVACTGGGGDQDLDLGGRDPRCVAACPASMPRYEGVGEVCNVESRVACLDQCEARIAGLPNVCQSCLLEDACFGPDGCPDDGSPVFCDTSGCTISSSFGTCKYNPADEAAKLRCYQQVDPRREVSCTTEFRPTSECAAVCS